MMKYKVVYKFNNLYEEQHFSNIQCAYTFAKRTNGVVLNAKGRD